MNEELEKRLINSIIPKEKSKRSIDRWYKKYLMCQEKGHIPMKGKTHYDLGKMIAWEKCQRCGVRYQRETTREEDKRIYEDSHKPIFAIV